MGRKASLPGHGKAQIVVSDGGTVHWSLIVESSGGNTLHLNICQPSQTYHTTPTSYLESIILNSESRLVNAFQTKVTKI